MKKNFETLWQKHKMLLLLTCGVILLQMVVGALLWERLPEQIATHFDFNNQPDGYSSRMFTVFGMPLILLFLHVVCLATISMPDEKSKVHSRKMRALMWFIVPAVSLLMTVVVYGYALGAPFHVGRVVVPFVGVLLAVSGNYMPKVRRNYTVGIKVPWTLNDEENWDKTHRFAAQVWVVGGILLAVLGLIGYTAWPTFALLMAIVFAPMVYSFVLYMKK
jgi:uncharacterized membrane protein